MSFTRKETVSCKILMIISLVNLLLTLINESNHLSINQNKLSFNLETSRKGFFLSCLTECKQVIYFPTMYIYCNYLAM